MMLFIDFLSTLNWQTTPASKQASIFLWEIIFHKFIDLLVTNKSMN